MHALTINLGICKYNGSELVLGYNLRVPVDTHVEVIKEGFKKALANYSNLEFGQAGYSPRHFLSLESELVSKLINAYQTITNDYESKPFTIGGGTYALGTGISKGIAALCGKGSAVKFSSSWLGWAAAIGAVAGIATYFFKKKK